MKVEIKIPSMGESVSEAIVSRIIQASGSVVVADQEILELETDKVNQVLYAPQAGKLTLNVALQQVVKIGDVIGFVDTDAKIEVASQAPKAPVEKPVLTPPPAQPAAPSGEKVTRKKMSSLRRTIAQKLVEVKNQTAMLTTFNEVDMSAVMAVRTKEQESFTKQYGVKLGFMSFFVKAVVAALKAYPEVNAYIDGDEIVTVHSHDIGVAVSTDKGLMVPVVKNCDQLSFAEIEKAIEEFAKKARGGTLSIDDLRGGSFTITNGGRFGSLLSTPILNPPQSAILGMHSIVKRAVVVDDQIVIRPMMYLAVSYDHRIIDGREAVLFLVHLKERLEDPNFFYNA